MGVSPNLPKLAQNCTNEQKLIKIGRILSNFVSTCPTLTRLVKVCTIVFIALNQSKFLKMCLIAEVKTFISKFVFLCYMMLKRIFFRKCETKKSFDVANTCVFKVVSFSQPIITIINFQMSFSNDTFRFLSLNTRICDTKR